MREKEAGEIVKNWDKAEGYAKRHWATDFCPTQFFLGKAKGYLEAKEQDKSAIEKLTIGIEQLKQALKAKDARIKELEEVLKDVHVGLQMARECDDAWFEIVQMDLDKALAK